MGKLTFINQSVQPKVTENVVILQQPISAEWIQEELARIETSVLPDASTDNKPYVRRNKVWTDLATLSISFVNGTTQTFDDIVVNDAEFNGIVNFDSTTNFNNGLSVTNGLATIPSIQSVNIVSTGLITGETADFNMIRTGYVRVSDTTDPLYTPVGGEVRYNSGQFEFYESGAWRTLVSGGYGYVADAPSNSINYVRRSGEWRRFGRDSIVFDDNTDADFWNIDVRHRAEINIGEFANITVNQLGSIARLRLLDFDPEIAPVNGHVRYNFESGRFEFYEQDNWRTLTSSVPEVSDAPVDGNIYYRKDGTWVRLGSESLSMDAGTTFSPSNLTVSNETNLNGIVTLAGTIVVSEGNERNIAGEIRFNSTSEKLEYHNGISWIESSAGGFPDVVIDNNPYYRKNQIWTRLGSENVLFDVGINIQIDSIQTKTLTNRNPVGSDSSNVKFNTSSLELSYKNSSLSSNNKTITLQSSGISVAGSTGNFNVTMGSSSVVINATAGGITINSPQGVTIGTNVSIQNLSVATLNSLGSTLGGITTVNGTLLDINTTDVDISGTNFVGNGSSLNLDYADIDIGTGEVVGTVSIDSPTINISGTDISIISTTSLTIGSITTSFLGRVVLNAGITIGDDTATQSGKLRYNSNTMQFYNGSTWKTLSEVGHTHTIANVTNLQTELDGKSNVGHLHDNNYSTGKIVASQVLASEVWTNIDVTDTSIKDNVYSVVAYELDGDGFWYPVILDWRVSSLPSNYIQVKSTVAGTFKIMIMFTTVS